MIPELERGSGAPLDVDVRGREEGTEVPSRPDRGGASHREPGGPGGAVEVWEVPLPGWSPAVARITEVLAAAERSRAERLVHADDRAGFVVSRAALRSILGARLGSPPGAVPLVREPCPHCGGPHGRPAVEDADVHLSTARSRGRALIALAPVPVGVDLETLVPPPPVEELRPALHPSERRAVEAAPAEDRLAWTLRCWVRKEAYLKGLGTGLAVDPAEVLVGPGRRPGAMPVTSVGPDAWALLDLPAEPGYLAALALAPVLGGPPELERRCLPLGAVLEPDPGAVEQDGGSASSLLSQG